MMAQDVSNNPSLHLACCLHLKCSVAWGCWLLQGNPLLICNKGDNETMEQSDKRLAVPPMVDCLQGILTIIPLQLLSMHLAEARKCDVRREPLTDTGAAQMGDAGGTVRQEEDVVHIIAIDEFITVWCCYNGIKFLQNPHNRHPIVCP